MAVTTNHYDLIVLGCDVAGLVAAALAARRGKRVLVIPHGSVEGTYRLGGRSLPLDIAPVIHMGTPPVQRVFQELGLLQQVRRQHASVTELVHLVLPDQRLDLEPASKNFEDELVRVWPDDPVCEAWALKRRWTAATEEVLDQLLSSDNALVADGFWGRRFLARVSGQLPGGDVDELAPLPADHPLRDGAAVYEPFLQHLSPAQLGKAAGLRLSGLWSDGPEDVQHGVARVRELLLQRIELHSGEVKRDLRVGEMLVKRGRVVGISLLGKRDRYGCDNLIVAMDPRRLLDGTLPPEILHKALSGTLSAIEPVGSRFVVHCEIHERGLSPALAGMVLCAPQSWRLADDPNEAEGWAGHGIGRTLVRLGPGSDDEHRLLSVSRIVRHDTPLTGLRDAIIDELDERGVLPFCRPSIRWMHSPNDGQEATDGRGEPVAELGSATGLQHAMDSIYLYHGEPSLGVGVVPHASGVKSMHLASRLTLPGLGLEGEFLAGTIAAGLVANPARSPFSRSSLVSRI